MSIRNVDLVERAAARFPSEPPAPPLPVDRSPDPSSIGLFHVEPAGRDDVPPFHGDFTQSRSCSLDLSRTIDWEGPRTPIMEEMRLIKRRLLQCAFDEGAVGNSRLVMITSPRPGEGKTFTSCNLALSIALEEDFDVLLVDADITRQTARRNFGIDSSRGLMDLLMRPELRLADVVLRTDIPRLNILPAGAGNLRAPELLASSRMRSLAASLMAGSPDRIIIFDSAPCLVSSDTPALAAHMGHVLLVVEARKTQEADIAASVQLIGACPDVSLVLNKARLGRSAAYGYYGAY